MAHRGGEAGGRGALPQGVAEVAELEEAGVGLGLAGLARARTSSRDSFGRALARVVPAAEGLKVGEVVVVAWLDVVDLVSGRAA